MFPLPVLNLNTKLPRGIANLSISLEMPINFSRQLPPDGGCGPSRVARPRAKSKSSRQRVVAPRSIARSPPPKNKGKSKNDDSAEAEEKGRPSTLTKDKAAPPEKEPEASSSKALTTTSKAITKPSKRESSSSPKAKPPSKKKRNGHKGRHDIVLGEGRLRKDKGKAKA